MCKLRFGISLVFLLFALVLTACGDLDALGGRNYKVSGLVNGVSLDDCAVIDGNGLIAPYFDCNIAEDTDTAALRVVIKNQAGKILGSPYRYVLPLNPKNTAQNNDAEDTETENTTAKQVDTANTIAKNRLPDGETGKTDSGASGTAEDEAKEETEPPVEDTIVEVTQFADNLPTFSFPLDTPSGFYTLIFMVIGNSGEVLHSSEKPVFYLGEKNLAFKELTSYLAGVSETPYTVPPGTLVMLEAEISADPSLEPYIIWYNGKNLIAEGEILDNVYRFLWKSPIQTGFQALRAEVFPFNPHENGFAIRGISREMSMPVSMRHGRHSYFANLSDQFTHWYELWGTVTDSKDLMTKSAALTAVPIDRKTETDEDSTPQNSWWLPKSGTYGLAFGGSHAWTLPGQPFMLAKDNNVLCLLLRFAPCADGVLLSTAFTDIDTGIQQTVQLALEGSDLVISSEKQGIITRQSIPMETDEQGIAVAAIEFQFLEKSLRLNTALEQDGVFKKWHALELSCTMQRRAPIVLGIKPAGIKKNPGQSSADGSNSDGGTTEVPAILTELAVFYPDADALLSAAVQYGVQEEDSVRDDDTKNAENDTDDTDETDDADDTEKNDEHGENEAELPFNAIIDGPDSF